MIEIYSLRLSNGNDSTMTRSEFSRAVPEQWNLLTTKSVEISCLPAWNPFTEFLPSFLPRSLCVPRFYIVSGLCFSIGKINQSRSSSGFLIRWFIFPLFALVSKSVRKWKSRKYGVRETGERVYACLGVKACVAVGRVSPCVVVSILIAWFCIRLLWSFIFVSRMRMT